MDLYFFFQHQDANVSTDVLSRFGQLLGTFIGIFLICDFGEKFATAFQKIQVDQIDWYLLLRDTQKLISTIMSITMSKTA